METMTKKQLDRRFIWAAVIGALATLGIPLFAAGEQEKTVVTLFTAAERFGIYATITAALIGFMMFSLHRIVNYTITRLETVVDDNSLCFNRFARAMAKRPCLSDSDVDKIISPDELEEESSDAVVKRVQARQKARRERGI